MVLLIIDINPDSIFTECKLLLTFTENKAKAATYLSDFEVAIKAAAVHSTTTRPHSNIGRMLAVT